MGFLVKMKQKGRQLCGFSLQSNPRDGKACLLARPHWGQQRQHPRRPVGWAGEVAQAAWPPAHPVPSAAAPARVPGTCLQASAATVSPWLFCLPFWSRERPRRWASCPGRREAGAAPYMAGRNPVLATTAACSPPRLRSRDARESRAAETPRLWRRAASALGGRLSPGLTAVDARPAAPERPLSAGRPGCCVAAAGPTWDVALRAGAVQLRVRG